MGGGVFQGYSGKDRGRVGSPDDMIEPAAPGVRNDHRHGRGGQQEQQRQTGHQAPRK